MITVKTSGSFKNIEDFFSRVKKQQMRCILEKYGREGVLALSSATPVESGLTAASWDYEIEENNGIYSIHWTNSNKNGEVQIAVILQTGHGLRGGGYVQGIDYINPALKPVFDAIVDEVWKEVTR